MFLRNYSKLIHLAATGALSLVALLLFFFLVLFLSESLLGCPNAAVKHILLTQVLVVVHLQDRVLNGLLLFDRLEFLLLVRTLVLSLMGLEVSTRVVVGLDHSFLLKVLTSFSLLCLFRGLNLGLGIFVVLGGTLVIFCSTLIALLSVVQ